MQTTDVANSQLTIFINHRTGIGGSVYPHLLDTVPSSGAARCLQLLIRRSNLALHGARQVRRDRLLYSCRTTRRRRGRRPAALRTCIQPRLARQEGCSDTSLCRLPALSADQSRHFMWRIGRPQTHFGGLSRWTGHPGPRHLARTHEDPNHCVSQWSGARMGCGE